MKDFTLNYHLMHPGGDSMPGDPNAAFYLDGVYHLHYILNHPWKGEKSCSFVHVTSPDMLNWTWQPTKLQPSFTGHGMFSGTGFITKEGLPAVIYYGNKSGRNQIAIAKNNELSEWEKPSPVEVKNPDGSDAEIERHWDPDCFLIGDTYYAISGGHKQPLFKSTDLQNWTLVGDFLSHELPDTMIGEDISCPNFFKLGAKWVLLCISHPLGCRYYIGEWDAEKELFVPEKHGRINMRREEQPLYGCMHRSDIFAPESVLTPDGRRVMWAWLTTPGPDRILINKTIQSLPRELTLPDDGILRIKPIKELEKQRLDQISLTDIVIKNPVESHTAPVPPPGGKTLNRIAELPGNSCEISIVISRKEAMRKLFGFILFADKTGNGLPIAIIPDTGTLRVGTTEAPFAAADLPEDEDLELRIFIDKYLVEVFANSRQAIVAAHLDYEDKNGLDAFSVATPTTIKSLDIWEIKPTNQGFLEAQKNHIWEPDIE
jgi:beta-fructofuranosidase